MDDRNVLLDHADRANAKVTIAVMANRDNMAHPVPDEALRKYGKFKVRSFLSVMCGLSSHELRTLFSQLIRASRSG